MVREVVEVEVVVGVVGGGVVSVVRVTTSVCWRRIKRGIRSSAARGRSRSHQGSRCPGSWQALRRWQRRCLRWL